MPGNSFLLSRFSLSAIHTSLAFVERVMCDRLMPPAPSQPRNFSRLSWTTIEMMAVQEQVSCHLVVIAGAGEEPWYQRVSRLVQKMGRDR
tara:strand:- start:91 stop:360 length:270 start_codon:yes stop_codon:yes gene_type:complete